MATRREYYFLIKQLLPFAKANVQRWQPERDQLSDGLKFTLYEGKVSGWGIDPFYLLIDGRIVRLTHDRDLRPRWHEIDIDTYDLGPDGWSSGLVRDRDHDFSPRERLDGAVIATMLDQLATEPLRAMLVRIPPGYPIEKVRKTLLRHVEEETTAHKEGSDWMPIILACVAIAAVVTLIMVVILFTNDVQFR